MSQKPFKDPTHDPLPSDAGENLQRTDAQKPIRALVTEFRTLYNELRPLINATQDGHGETVRMTINVPKEWAMLAAWLHLRERKRGVDDFSPLPYAIDLDPRFAHRQHAKSYLRHLLNDLFHYELHLLAIGAHPYLYERKAQPQKAEDYDDDIPF